MNSDDPKLTAYALDELDPSDRAEIEQLLRNDPTLRAELEETNAFTARLRSELQAEAGTPLTDAQRASVLTVVHEEKVATEPAAVIHFPWWRRRAPLALAASIALCGGAVVLLGVRFYLGADALLKSAGISDPRGWDRYSRFERLAIRVGDGVTGKDLAENLGAPASENPREDASVTSPPNSPLLATAGTATAAPEVQAPSEFTDNSKVTSSYTSRGLVLEDKGSIGLPVDSPALSLQPPTPIASATPIPANLSAAVSSGPMINFGAARIPSLAPAERDSAKQTQSAAMTKSPATMGARFGALSPASPAAAAGAAKPAPSMTIALRERQAKKTKGEERSESVDSAETISTLSKDKSVQSRTDAVFSTEAYDAISDNAFLAVHDNPLSTFSIDVDTASYANVRRFLTAQTLPPKGAVRIEELLNYFTYDYPQPDGDAPFSATMEVAACPWMPEHRLVRIGLKGREIAKDKRPASNLVFLIDVSGSMQPENKLPLLKKSLRLLVDQLTPEDTVSIAVYAGASGTVLEPTHDKRAIRDALDRLESGGSTNGAAGIQLAYRLAAQSFIKGGVNRVILATDGDFNVGVTSQSELTDLIERQAKGGTFLTVLGFGMGNLKDSTLEKLADKGNGNYAYIDTLNEGRKVLVEQISGTLVTIAKDVKIQVEFNPAQVGSYRLIGYENRLLAKEDFNDDKKDAGEIGAGHTVTALYEIVPAGVALDEKVDALKYQKPQPVTETATRAPSAEMLTLKLRYKQPDGDKSKLLEFPLTDRGETWEKSSRDFRFAAAVASFGMLLRDSPHKGAASWEAIRELAVEGQGEDRGGYRAEFLTLLDKARALTR